MLSVADHASDSAGCLVESDRDAVIATAVIITAAVSVSMQSVIIGVLWVLGDFFILFIIPHFRDILAHIGMCQVHTGIKLAGESLCF